MIKYELIISWSEEDGPFIAEVPLGLWIETAKEFGDPIPEPKGRRLIFA